MERVAVWTINASLFALGCFLLASTLSRVIEAAVAPTPAPVSTQVETAQAPHKASWQERQAILNRNLFASVSTGTASQPDTTDQRRFEETKLPLELLGTIAAGIPANSIAAVMNTQKKKAVVVRTGDTIAGSAKVQRIDRRRIVLLHNGKLEELTLSQDKPSAASPSRRNASTRQHPPQPRRSRPTRRRSFGRSIPSLGKKLASIRKNPASLLTQASIQPRYESGKLAGIEVGKIKPGSLLESAGLKNGDVIVEFNGIPINSPQQSAALMNEFNQANNVNLTIRGANGQESTINLKGTP